MGIGLKFDFEAIRRGAGIAALAAALMLIFPTQIAQAGLCTLPNLYSTDWLNVNFLIVGISFAVIAVVYMLGNIMHTVMSSKIKGLIKDETRQTMLSVIIIVILLGSAATIAEFSSYLAPNQTYTCNPILSSQTYVFGTLTGGVGLLNNIYATSISYAVDARLYSGFGGLASPITDKLSALLTIPLGIAKVTPEFANDLGISYSIISDLLVIIFTPLMMLALGSLFMQWLLLLFLPGTAFAFILPAALIMRSFAFTGAGLRSAANGVLAIAIGAYMIYPVMVLVNASVVGWIYTSPASPACASNLFGCNPTFTYLNTANSTMPSTPEGFFTSSTPGTGVPLSSLFGGVAITSLSSQQLNSVISGIDPATTVSALIKMSNSIAQFIFTGVFLFALDIAVTIGFVAGLTKALNSGVYGAESFWNAL